MSEFVEEVPEEVVETEEVLTEDHLLQQCGCGRLQ